MEKLDLYLYQKVQFNNIQYAKQWKYGKTGLWGLCIAMYYLTIPWFFFCSMLNHSCLARWGVWKSKREMEPTYATCVLSIRT